MNAIVNNATGLLGACLVRALRWEGHRVTAVVREMSASEWMSDDPGVHRVLQAGGGLPELSSADVLFETPWQAQTPGARREFLSVCSCCCLGSRRSSMA